MSAAGPALKRQSPNCFGCSQYPASLAEQDLVATRHLLSERSLPFRNVWSPNGLAPNDYNQTRPRMDVSENDSLAIEHIRYILAGIDRLERAIEELADRATQIEKTIVGHAGELAGLNMKLDRESPMQPPFDVT